MIYCYDRALNKITSPSRCLVLSPSCVLPGARRGGTLATGACENAPAPFPTCGLLLTLLGDILRKLQWQGDHLATYPPPGTSPPTMVPTKANLSEWADAAKVREQGTALLCTFGKAGSAFSTVPNIGEGVQPWDRHVPPLPILCQCSPHRLSWLRTPPKRGTHCLAGAGWWPGAPPGPQQGAEGPIPSGDGADVPKAELPTSKSQGRG